LTPRKGTILKDIVTDDEQYDLDMIGDDEDPWDEMEEEKSGMEVDFFYGKMVYHNRLVWQPIEFTRSECSQNDRLMRQKRNVKKKVETPAKSSEIKCSSMKKIAVSFIQKREDQVFTTGLIIWTENWNNWKTI
jgi:hypothetical protein